MVEREYFVKFIDQSFWHCSWMCGAILFALHANKLRNFFNARKRHGHLTENIQDEQNTDGDPVPNADSGIPSMNLPSSLPATISHSSEDETDEEDDLTKWDETTELPTTE